MQAGGHPVMGKTHHFDQRNQMKIKRGDADRVHKFAPAIVAGQHIWNDRKATDAIQNQRNPQPDEIHCHRLKNRSLTERTSKYIAQTKGALL